MVFSPSLSLSARIEHWPIAGSFTISRGSKTEAAVVVAELTDGTVTGRGECVPYPRYGESPEQTLAAIENLARAFADGISRDALQKLVPPGAARNALDCALLDFEAKRKGQPVWQLCGLVPPKPVTTAFTISLGSPEAMAKAASAAAFRPLLKIKLGGDGDIERLQAVRAAAPHSKLIVDANEAWRADRLADNFAACAALGVVMIEQPLPADDDAALADIPRLVPVCADESVHDRAGLAALRSRYDAINIKLDKTGGLTEALALAEEAERLGFRLMVGCMVATSLAMAPAMLIAQRADVVDLDGPLLLARDRPDGLVFDNSVIHPPLPALWG